MSFCSLTKGLTHTWSTRAWARMRRTKVPKHKDGADISNYIDLRLSSPVRFHACGSVSHEGQPPLVLSQLCRHEARVWRGMGRTVKYKILRSPLPAGSARSIDRSIRVTSTWRLAPLAHRGFRLTGKMLVTGWSRRDLSGAETPQTGDFLSLSVRQRRESAILLLLNTSLSERAKAQLIVPADKYWAKRCSFFFREWKGTSARGSLLLCLTCPHPSPSSSPHRLYSLSCLHD